MESKPRVLVVDDEPEVRDMVEEYLQGHGFAVCLAADAAEARRQLAAQPFDLALLDVTMPGEDGLSLARHVREAHGCGIIMLTAAASVVDRIVGLEVGADDYVPKPFDPRELLARIRSVLRRLAGTGGAASAAGSAGASAGAGAGSEGGSGERLGPGLARTGSGAGRALAPDAGRQVPMGRCILDLDARRLSTPDGREMPITAMEFDLLKAFADRPNRVLTRDQLLDLAHNRDSDPFDRSIDIRIARVRRKIEVDATKPDAIKTIRGAGYMFVPPGSRRGG